MRYIVLLIVLVISACAIVSTTVVCGTYYKVQHDRMLLELLEKHGTPPPLPPDGVRIPGGVEIQPGKPRSA